MKIAVVNEWWGAGAGRCARDLHQCFLARGHQSLLLPENDTGDLPALRARLQAFAPDIVNAHSFYGNRSFPYTELAPFTRIAPVVFTVHDPRPIGIFEVACWDCSNNRNCRRCPLAPSWRHLIPPLNTFYRTRLRKRWTHRRCAPDLRLVGPSNWICQRLSDTELSRFRIDHIFNGINLSRFHPETPPHLFRASIPPRVPTLLHVAHSVGVQLNARKGLPLVWESFLSHVLPRFPEARLVIAGEGVVPNHPAVIPLGQINPDDMPAVYAACDLYVTATQADNLPYTAIEAMACGLPVVATRVGGLPEIVVPGETGYLIEPGDGDALAGAILRYFSDSGLRRTHGEAGARAARKNFNLEQTCDRYLRIMEEQVTARRRTTAG